jgi:tRNA modification GTPase
VLNKSDLLPDVCHAQRLDEIFSLPTEAGIAAKHAPGGIHVSTLTGHNIDPLRYEIIRRVTARDHAGGERLALNHRHRALLLEALRAIRRAGDLAKIPAAHVSPELLAAEMRIALDLLGQITGTISPDEVLGRIFSQFCIGK